MTRRLRLFALALACLILPALLGAAVIEPPQDRHIKVAVVLTEGATMIDFAGPWEVFQDVMVESRGKTMDEQMPFELFTVGASRAPVKISGGLTVTPDYTFANAPAADVVVVGAQRGAPELTAWLKKMHGKTQIMMSVCTGAFKFAEAGLFDGKQATTHHDFTDRLAAKYPKVTVVPSMRFVKADSDVYSAGGLTSGIDLALHVVELYFGRETAERTAKYMEYEGTGWLAQR